MSNFGKKEMKVDNSDLMEAMRQVGREMGQSIKMGKYANEIIDENENDDSFSEKQEKRKSILDIILPEGLNKNSNQNNKANDSVNVVMFGKRNTFGADYYSNLFEDDENEGFKKVKNVVAKDFYERKLQAIEKKEKKLEVMRNKKKEEEMKHFKKKPQINKVSQKIMEKKKNEIKPIHHRVNEIVDKKFLKIDRLKQIYREIENAEHSKYSMAHTHFDEKKFEQWLNKQMRWELEKKSKIESVKEENERLETSIMQSMYRPTIDRNSENLVKSKILNSENSSKLKEDSVYEKLYSLKDEKYNKMVKRLVDSIPSFTPTINKNVPNFKKNCNPKITNFERNNRNQSSSENEKKSNNRKHYRSVEERNNFDVIHEEEGVDGDYNLPAYVSNFASNYGSSKKAINSSNNYQIKSINTIKKGGVNTSMNDNYNNPLDNNESGEENDFEGDVVQQYKKALLGENKNSSKNIMRTKSTGKNEGNEQKMKKIDLFDSSLYKINVRNGSAWDKDRVNNIVYNPASNKTKTNAK